MVTAMGRVRLVRICGGHGDDTTVMMMGTLIGMVVVMVNGEVNGECGIRKCDDGIAEDGQLVAAWDGL